MNYHTYEIDWTPDTITWKVDGQVGRTKQRKDTWNATSNQWMFPQSPARVQLSLWPAGLASNGQGTIDWAGGLVDWQSADIKNNGYYYAAFESVTMTCYNAASAPGTNKNKSYYFNGYSGTNDTVVDSSNATILASFQGTGLDMDAGAPVVVSGTTAAPSATATAESVPGLSGGSPGVDSHNSVVSGSDQTATTSIAAVATSGSSTGFSQNLGTGSKSTSGGEKAVGGQEKVLQSSLFGVIIAVAAMMAL